MQPQHTKGFYRGMALEAQQHLRTLSQALQETRQQFTELQAAVALLVWSAPDHRLSLPISPDEIPDNSLLRRKREDDGTETWWVEAPVKVEAEPLTVEGLSKAFDLPADVLSESEAVANVDGEAVDAPPPNPSCRCALGQDDAEPTEPEVLA